MTVVQAARELECSPELVYKLCARGKLGHTRIGFGRGRILIGVEQIAAYRLRCEVLPADDWAEPERERARMMGIPDMTGIPDLVGEYLARRKGRRAKSR